MVDDDLIAKISRSVQDTLDQERSDASFSLLVFEIDGQVQWVSNCERGSVSMAMDSLLAHWRLQDIATFHPSAPGSH